jgi:hypothetical protein
MKITVPGQPRQKVIKILSHRFMPVVPASQDAEVAGFHSETDTRQKHKTENKPKQKGLRAMAQGQA